MEKIKVFVPDGQNNYASWFESEIVNSVEEADLVLLSGGADINPALYGESKGKFTGYNEYRDRLEVAAYNKAKELGKKIWGTCRGLMWASLNGVNSGNAAMPILS